MEGKHVRRWIDADESASEMLGRVLSERPVMILPPPLHRIPVRTGNAVEISGPSPSAKTLLLIQAAVNCILPTEWKGVNYGGLGQLVLYIDLDCRFEVTRLLEVLRCRIAKANGKGREGDPPSIASDDELVSLCLSRFSYIRCYHTFEFLATLKTLHQRIESERRSHSARVQLLLIDNIGAFHWVDRASTASPSELHNRKSLSLQSVWEAVVQDLRKLLLAHPMLVIASKAAIFGSTVNGAERHFQGRFSGDTADQRDGMKESQRHKFREYMPSTWQAFVTHRVLVQTSDEHIGTGSHQKDGDQPVHHLEWLLPALSITDKFVVGDAGVVLAS